MGKDVDESVLDLMLQDPGLEDVYKDGVNREEIRTMLAVRSKDNALAWNPADLRIREKSENRINVEVDEDCMIAWINLRTPEVGEARITEAELRQTLAAYHIVKGIKEEYVKRLAQNPIYDTAFIIARGMEARDGVSGEIKYYFEDRTEFHATELDTGNINYKELNFVQEVKKDDMLCEIIKAEKGVDGYTVDGRQLKAEGGKEIVLPAGSNTYSSEDGTQLFAACDGEVSIKNGKVVVDKVLCVENVDATTGNLRFIGSIQVNGRIGEGFTVTATENIRVGEVIEGAVVKAGGDIIATSGMKGSARGTVTAGGDIYSPFIENTTVTLSGNLFTEAVLNSFIECDGRVSVLGKKGCLIGGKCKASEVEIYELGNEANVATIVEINDTVAMEREIVKLGVELKEWDKTAEKLSCLLKRGNVDQLETQKEWLTALYKKNEYSSKKNEMSERVKKMKKEYSFDIKIRREIHANVYIRIGSQTYHNLRGRENCVFFRMSGHIVARNFNG